MKSLSKKLTYTLVSLTLGIVTFSVNATDNQTDDLSPILSGAALPFQITIEKADFQLPVGIHSGVVGTYKGLWIFIAGRTNGLHGFNNAPIPPNFPPDFQNTSIYVVNPSTGTVFARSLTDPSSGLTQQQIDTLSVTSPQGYQEANTLYMTGGYGIDTASGAYGTKPVLTAFYLPGIVDWVTQPGNPHYSVINNIRQIFNPLFQVTGGKMFKVGNMTQLVFGQNFTGPYVPGSNGEYIEQVRKFQLKDSKGQLYVDIYPSQPNVPDPNFRRRDLNIAPVLLNKQNKLHYGLVAYAGVFTEAGGVWTVPVIIDEAGNPAMPNPTLATTFKQGMNQYTCAIAGLYSKKYMNMYNLFFGGISYGYYDGGVFMVDAEIPFINQVTTVQIDRNGNFTQYLMEGQYPIIPSTHANPGNPLLFGAGAYFIGNNISQYSNSVINLDNIRAPTVIGYIAGGIQSTLPNTNFATDSSASPYVFKVILQPS